MNFSDKRFIETADDEPQINFRRFRRLQELQQEAETDEELGIEKILGT
jgi:hypothetical protein